MIRKRLPKNTKINLRGRPRDADKDANILLAAAQLFLSEGYLATSMDDIASAAQVAKLTLYKRYPSKEALFVAVINDKCQHYLPDSLFAPPKQEMAKQELTKQKLAKQDGPQQILYKIGLALMTLIMSDDAIRLYRMMGSEAEHNPKMTKLFYDTGPARVKHMLGEQLQRLHQLGMLHVPDTKQARDFFAALFSGSELYMRRMLNLDGPADAKTIERHVRAGVKTFIRAYSADSAQK